MKPNQTLIPLLTATGLALLTGCASTEPMTGERFARAETGIELAQESGAANYAGESLARAREMLRQAEAAAEDGDEERAARLAERAALDAELAAAETDHRKTEDALSEVNESIADLRAELARNEIQ